MRPSECPGFILKDNGDVQLYDYPSFYNFTVGDQLYLGLRFGNKIYDIVKVQPANLKDYPSEMTLVTARPK